MIEITRDGWLFDTNTGVFLEGTVMQVTYQLTQKGLREALTAHRNQSASIFLRPVSYLLLLAFFGGLCVLLAHFNSARFSTDLRLLEFGSLWAAILWALPWVSARQQFFRTP